MGNRSCASENVVEMSQCFLLNSPIQVVCVYNELVRICEDSFWHAHSAERETLLNSFRP